jgi:hypothetical protein
MSDFAAIAPCLNCLQADPQARLIFDMFAAALVWSDEVQPVEDLDLLFANIGKIRGVLHYRTTLILGAPREQFRSAWEEVQELCHNWPVFIPARRDPNLAPVLIDLRDRTTKKWEDDLARIEKQLSEKQRKAIA